MREQDFDSLVASFYRAATGAIDWQVPLAATQSAFNARFAVLHTLDLSDGRLISLHSGHTGSAEAELEYIREYHRLDPRRARTVGLGAAGFGQWQHDHEHFDAGFRARDRFYQHYVPAYGTRHNAHVAFPVHGTTLTGFALELDASRDPLDADEREWARRLGEHVREALLAHHRLRSLVARMLAGHALLNSFPYPMWLIDADRAVAYENPAAQQETALATRVARRGALLALVANAADRQLTERLHRLGRAGHGASAALDLRPTRADPPTWLHLSLLVPGAALGAFGDRPQVLATLFDPAHVSPLDPFALASMFDLTPTEAKVAARMADGLTAEQIGQAHGTLESTVRTQIKQVLHKLGARRAADVVRMLRQGGALWSEAGAAMGGAR